MARCIDCYALRAHLPRGAGAVHLAGRRTAGRSTRLRPRHGRADAARSSCVSCGACVDACPTGALAGQVAARARARRSTWTRTTCPYCGVGCEMQVGTRGGPDRRRAPGARRAGQQGAPLLEGALRLRLRQRGRPGHHADDPRAAAAWRGGLVGRGHRATSPSGCARIVAAHGPDAVGVLGSARATNEENYVMQKFARVVLGTNNVDCCARVCHAPSAAALKAMLGTGAATNSFDDIERARTILVCGSNATDCHPIVGARIRQAALRGAKLIVHRPAPHRARRDTPTSTSRRGPGPTCCCFNAMAHVDPRGGPGRRGVRPRAGRRARRAPRARAAAGSPERVAPLCGVDADAHPPRRAPVRDRAARAVRARARPDGARAGHRDRDGARQPRAAHRQRRAARGRRQPAARPEQRPGRRRTWAASRST